MEIDDELKIDKFLEKLNSEEFQSIESRKEILPQFIALDDILDAMNEIQILFENPDLKINKQLRNKISIAIPVKSNNEDDEILLKEIKSYKNKYEMDAKKFNEFIDNIKNNFIILSGSIEYLIKSVEKSKVEYFETIKLMISPMTVQMEKLNKIDINKFNKEKKINYEDKRSQLDNIIEQYDKKLSIITSGKKEILEKVKQNIIIYINSMNKLYEPINTMIGEIENIFNSFEEKGKKFINNIMNYTNPEEKKVGMNILNEINELNNRLVSLIDENYLNFTKNKYNIEMQIKECNNRIENIRQNNLPSSELLMELQDETKSIIKEINDLLKFCWIKTKIPQITKDLKGFQLYNIKSKLEEGEKTIIKMNEKLIENFNELKNFVKEKDEILKNVFN